MDAHLQALRAISARIDRLELDHNDILDSGAHSHLRLGELSSETQMSVNHLRSQCDELKSLLSSQVHKAKRATLILSLLAQRDELETLKRRIDSQPYEMYARSSWMREQLEKL